MKLVSLNLLLVALPFCAALTISPKDIQNAMLIFWDSDTNCALDGQVELDFQDHTNTGDRVDNAPRKLFKKVDSSLLQKPTYKALMELFDAYASSGATQSNAAKKISNFFEAIMTTGPYKALQKVLAEKGYQPAKNDGAFRKALTELWFGDYSRRAVKSQSSGFEHVFVGEIKNGQVSGLHNWVRMYWLETHNQLDYTGFIVKRPRVAILQYKMGNAWKQSGSVVIGTSPEFDFAIFTLCFLARPGEDACQFFLGDCTPVEISSFPWNQGGNVYLATAYASPWKTNEKCPVAG